MSLLLLRQVQIGQELASARRKKKQGIPQVWSPSFSFSTNPIGHFL